MSAYDCWHKCVFSFRWDIVNDEADAMSSGRLYKAIINPPMMWRGLISLSRSYVLAMQILSVTGNRVELERETDQNADNPRSEDG